MSRRAEHAFCTSYFSSLFTSEQSVCCSGVFWGELPCTPSGAQITWCVPVLIQGAEIRELTQGPERGCQPARPVASRPFLRLTCLFLPRRYLGLTLLSVEELGISQLSSLPTRQRGPEPSRTPTPPPVRSWEFIKTGTGYLGQIKVKHCHHAASLGHHRLRRPPQRRLHGSVTQRARKSRWVLTAPPFF